MPFGYEEALGPSSGFPWFYGGFASKRRRFPRSSLRRWDSPPGTRKTPTRRDPSARLFPSRTHGFLPTKFFNGRSRFQKMISLQFSGKPQSSSVGANLVLGIGRSR